MNTNSCQCGAHSSLTDKATLDPKSTSLKPTRGRLHIVKARQGEKVGADGRPAMTDHDFMRLAIEWSRKGMENGNMGPIGAVVVRDGVVLGQGHNRCQADLDITAHGEMVAIRDGITRTGSLEGLRGATMFTTAQPCPMCYCACRWAGIVRIVYSLSCDDTYSIGSRFGFDDAALYADLQAPEAERAIPQEQLLREEALPVLQDWAVEAERYFNS